MQEVIWQSRDLNPLTNVSLVAQPVGHSSFPGHGYNVICNGGVHGNLGWLVK